MAVAGFGVATALILARSAFSTQLVLLPPWMAAVLDIAVVYAPLTAAVLLAGRAPAVAGSSRAAGRPRAVVTDIAFGLALGLLLRAFVELLAPTMGTLDAPFGNSDPAHLVSVAVVAVGAVTVSPVIEELFFRGLVQRASTDVLADAGRSIAAVTAVLVSTSAFVALHAIALGGTMSASLLVTTIAVGVGCGVVTTVTGRLTAAIVAHVMFNAVGVMLLLI